MSNYHYAQIFVLVAMVVGCAALMLKSKVSLAKLLVAVALTILCIIELLNTPLKKRIASLSAQVANLEKYSPHDPALPGLRIALDDARRLYAEVSADPRRWPERLPFNLGLDLRGGTEIRLALRLDSARISRIKTEIDKLTADRKASVGDARI
jgi:hypothetical protein